MRYLLINILLILVFCSNISSAQYYDTGQDPASVKWLQIKTDRFRVIYPESYGEEGKLYAKSLDESYSKLNTIFPPKKFHIPVIIHSYSAESNGYVAWAPKRMELYPTPEQNTIPLDTRTQLTIHEMTHVFELTSLNQGFSKAMALILGEQFTGITSILLPLWYFEGNAVFAESLLTESGRGRSPAFLKEFKAIAVDNNKMYKYDMIVNDSYRKYVPDHYQSGYQMVTYGLAKKGMDLWNNTLAFTGRNPYLLDPVNITLSKNAGLTKKKLYKETFDSLKILWNKELAQKDIIDYNALNPDKNGEFINYSSPVSAGTDSIIAIKISLKDPYAFVLINTATRTEKKLLTPGQMYPFTLSYGGGKITWVENKPDPRWDNRNYSVIKVMDLKSRKIRSLSKKSRYFAVSLSPDGTKIAASENTVENKNNLVIISTETGEILQSVKAPQNASLQRPRWDNASDRITVISLTEDGEGILAYSTRNLAWETFLEYGRDNIQSAEIRNDSLFYISSVSETENIYLRLPSGDVRCLTRSKFGINDLFLKESTIFFSNYTVSGFNIGKTSINEISDKLTKDPDRSSLLINRFENKSAGSQDNDLSIYKPEPYRKYQHIFRFHSWMPFYADLDAIKSDPSSVRPGLTVMSQNQLSSVVTTVGYEYSENKEHLLHTKLTLKGWYPVFETRLDYGGDPGVYSNGETTTNPEDIKRGIRSVNSVYIPLRFATGKFLQYIQPSVSYDYRNNYVYLKEEGKYDYGQGLLSGQLYFSNYFRSSRRDIYPRWAQTIDFNYTYSPLNASIYPYDIALKTSFYTPGFLPNNSIKLRYQKEKQGEAKYSLNNRISLPRGYKDIISKDLDFISADYVFPLAYPDFNISSLMYLKRIRCSLFGDYAVGTDNLYLKDSGSGKELDYRHEYREIFQSFGFEILADFHVLRLPFMISGGLQTAWKDISKQPVFEILFNIELFGMAINQSGL